MLSEKAIIEELEISRTPFRDAINLLERDGLIETRPNHGFYVTRLSSEDTVEIFDVRFLLEPSVAELAAYRITDEMIADLRTRTERALQGSLEEMFREDEYFHMSILHTIDNKYLIRTMEMIYSYFRLSNPRSRRANSAVPSLKEHLIILDALKERSPQKAAEATKEHLIASRKRAMGLLF